MQAAENVAVRTLASDLGFSEGPVIAPDGTIFATSVTKGLVYRVEDGGASVVADLGGGANGLTIGADGTLYVAQNGGRLRKDGPRFTPDLVAGVQAIEPDGEVRWVTQDPIAPNDLCLGPDGLLYVTDPTRTPRADDGRVWRIDPDTGAAEILGSMPWYPNGIGFGPDDRLYVASTGEGRIVRFDVLDGRLVDEHTAVRTDPWHPDGFAFDANGDLLVCVIAEDGSRPLLAGDEPGQIQVFSPAGTLLRTLVPGTGQFVTNLAIGPDGTMVVAASDAEQLVAIDGRSAPGLPLHPFR